MRNAGTNELQVYSNVDCLGEARNVALVKVNLTGERLVIRKCRFKKHWLMLPPSGDINFLLKKGDLWVI